mgnify:CR=1 FL=1
MNMIKGLIINPTRRFKKSRSLQWTRPKRRKNPFAFTGDKASADSFAPVKKRRIKKAVKRKAVIKPKKLKFKKKGDETKMAKRGRKKSRVTRSAVVRRSVKRSRRKLPSALRGKKRSRAVVYHTKRYLRRPPKNMRRLKKRVMNPVKIGKLLGNTQALVVDASMILAGYMSIGLITPIVEGVVGGVMPVKGWTKTAVKGVTAVALTSVLGFIDKKIALKVGSGAMASVLTDVVQNFNLLPVQASTDNDTVSAIIGKSAYRGNTSMGLGAILNKNASAN